MYTYGRGNTVREALGPGMSRARLLSYSINEKNYEKEIIVKFYNMVIPLI